MEHVDLSFDMVGRSARAASRSTLDMSSAALALVVLARGGGLFAFGCVVCVVVSC